MDNLKINEWDNSYQKKDNFIFFPNEEVIRFVSKYIKKRVGFNDFINQSENSYNAKVLDFGCGMGRHIKLLDEFELNGYGFDLSEEAIKNAKVIFKQQNLEKLSDKIIIASITNLPYQDNFFDFMLSHGVLDSMPFNIAKEGIKELHRCCKPLGKIYFDLISDIDSSFIDNCYDKEVQDNHEKGTIQSYYDENRINELIKDLFKIKELKLNINKNLLTRQQSARYSVIVEKI